MKTGWIFGLIIFLTLLVVLPAGAENVMPVNASINGKMMMVYLTEENAGSLTVSPVQVVVTNVTTGEFTGNTGTVIAYAADNGTIAQGPVTMTATKAGGVYTVSVVTVTTGTVIPVNNLTFSTMSARSAFFKQTLHAGANETWVDLSWPDTRSSLDLMVYAPDATLGPFNDTADGRADNRIFLNVAGKSPVTPGDWYYRVRNTGNETTPYTLNTYTS